MKIAVSGKGGVGKTTVCAFLIHALAEQGRKVLAIDADSSPHLARVLNFPEAECICPIADMKELMQERSERQGPFYKLNPKVDDLPEKFMKRKGNIKLMVLGAVRRGGGGCACADNTVLRTLLNTLLLGSDEDIILDMEAGVEHLGRGTIAGVDRLIVVVQPYRGSLETAVKIRSLASDLGLNNVGFVANNVRDEADRKFLEKTLKEKLLVVLPASDEVRRAEREGLPVYESSPAFASVVKDLVKVLAQD